MRRLLIFIFIAMSFQSNAQQDAIYSQYMFNPFAINPAYAGSRSSYSAVLLHRSQWVGVGFDGAPMTQSFALHAPAGKSGIAWGINFAYDQLGPSKNFIAGGTGAYIIKFKESKLSFALRAGIYNTVFDRSILNFKDQNDQVDIGGRESAMVPSFDFGAYYYMTKFYVGLSVNHLTRHQFKFDDFPDTVLTNMHLRQHVMLNAGYVWEWKRNFVVKPSVLVKYVPGAPVNVDINVSGLLYKRVWLGVSFRTSGNLVLLTDVNITDFMRVGYAYDLNIFNKLGSYSKGSHEVFLGFDFNLKNRQTISPRYL